MDIFRNKYFISFKLHTILSIIIKFHVVLLCPAQDMNHLFIHHILSVCHLVVILVIRSTIAVTVLVFKSPLFYLIMVPKGKSNDVGNLDILLQGLIYELNITIDMYPVSQTSSLERVGFSVSFHMDLKLPNLEFWQFRVPRRVELGKND